MLNLEMKGMSKNGNFEVARIYKIRKENFE